MDRALISFRKSSFDFFPVLLISIAVLGIIQFSTPNLVGNDGYFHVKFAQILWERGPFLEFDWLPFSLLNQEDFTDHHFLYHVLLIPFTFGNLAIGAKLASILFPSLMVTIFFVVLREQEVPFPAFWAIGLLAISEAFLFRILMPRTQALGLIIMIVAIHLLVSNKNIFLFPLAFIFVWTYDAFPLLIIIIALYIAVNYLYEGRFDISPLWYGSAGIIAGLIINPFFPNNIIFAWNHISAKYLGTTQASVGNEWDPYTTSQLLENSGLTFLLLIIGIVALGWAKGRLEKKTLFVLGLTVLFGFMLFQSRRFIEFFPPIVLVFVAFATSSLSSSRIKEIRIMSPHLVKLFAGFGLGLLLIINGLESIESLESTKPLARYEESSAWLSKNTANGTRVFHTDWDDFPQLFFHNAHNTYIVGLDPTYLELYDSRLYELWKDVTKGRVDKPSDVIARQFAASYVITDLDHVAFIQKALEDAHMEVVHQDKYSLVFRINN
jgi:hypothetical protein